MKVGVRIEGVQSLISKFSKLEREVFPEAAARAIKRVQATIRSRAADDIAAATGLKASSVRRRIVLRKHPTKTDPSAVLEITGNPFNLIEFVSGAKEPRSPRGGVTANAWGNKRKYPGVFLARMPNGQVLAVQRSRAGRGARNALALARAQFLGRSGPKLIQRGRWAGKSPHIEAVFGAGIVREAARPKLMAAREAVMRERLPIELAHEVKFRMAKLLVRGAKRRST